MGEKRADQGASDSKARQVDAKIEAESKHELNDRPSKRGGKGMIPASHENPVKASLRAKKDQGKE